MGKNSKKLRPQDYPTLDEIADHEEMTPRRRAMTEDAPDRPVPRDSRPHSKNNFREGSIVDFAIDAARDSVGRLIPADNKSGTVVMVTGDAVAVLDQEGIIHLPLYSKVYVSQ
jgi:hypothetical protein